MSIFPAVRAAAICSIRPTSTPTFDSLPRRPRFRPLCRSEAGSPPRRHVGMTAPITTCYQAAGLRNS